MTAGDVMERRLARERAARQAAERLLEEKSLALYEANQRLEESLQSQYEMSGRLKAVLDHIVAAIIWTDGSGAIQGLNPAAERIFGRLSGDLEALEFQSLIAPEDRAPLAPLFAPADDGAVEWPLQGEAAALNGQGERFPVEYAVTETDVHGRRHLVWICRDLTARKQAEAERAELERELRHAQKLEALGTLSGGIAHEINTPIQFVGDNISFLQDAFADVQALLDDRHALIDGAAAAGVLGEGIAKARELDELTDIGFLKTEVPSALEQALEGVGRVAAIVQAIKEFAHPGADEKTPVDLNRAINTTIEVTRSQWKQVATLETDLDADLPPVHCLPGDFNQVILNLIVNAAQALEDGDGVGVGVIQVATARDGDQVVITVSDTGCGIPKALQEKVFEPFFTTKDVGRGSGQGLALVYSIVTKKHGGTIALRSEEGQGATFSIRLPIGDGDGLADAILVEAEASDDAAPLPSAPPASAPAVSAPPAAAPPACAASVAWACYDDGV